MKYIGLQIPRLPIREMEHWPHSRDTWEKSQERDINTLCPSWIYFVPVIIDVKEL